MTSFSHQASGFLGCVHIVSCEAFQDTVSCSKLLESYTASLHRACRPGGGTIQKPERLRIRDWSLAANEKRTQSRGQVFALFPLSIPPLHSSFSPWPPGAHFNLPYLTCCLPMTPFLLGQRRKGRQGRLREGIEHQPPADITS